MDKKTTVLVVLNGYGILSPQNDSGDDKDRFIEDLMETCPYSKCLASGMAVGLPNGQMGDSYVGHINIGAGRIVYQDLSRITKDIQDGTFFENERLKNAVSNIKNKDSALHLCGLISDGGIHSHLSHLYALLEFAKRQDIRRVYVHCFMDGMDSAPDKGAFYLERLQAKMREIGVGEIATVSGRYYAMDRGNNYDRIKLVYLAMTEGEGIKAANADEAIRDSYAAGDYDTFIKPTVIVNGGVPVGIINDDDTVIFFNFRPDRSRELAHAFCDDEFRSFKREKKLDIFFATLTEYDVNIEDKLVIYDEPVPENAFGKWLETNELTQLRLAESENALFVTYAFNGYTDEVYDGEERMILPSPKLSADEYRPEMSSVEITDRLCRAMASHSYDFILCDYAALDIAGHTTDMENRNKAMETIDNEIKKVCKCADEEQAFLFICSTHGNIEKFRDKKWKQEKSTAHTTNPIPFIFYDKSGTFSLKNGGCLADIVPTIIDFMGYEKPKEMTGKSLLIKDHENTGSF
ncbi:MAG: 2,3-bisphosphoglycerate-independent phosphoglycerate mutase [Lachnospiraceae bacterium]|nr:2,3-bisphosphoglycerate-independent phosphoglycerate mutase [Lachnospiraceae bacterium]